MANDNPMPSFSIIQVGPMPPPYGGISVHVKRLHEKMLANGIASSVSCPPNAEVGNDRRIRATKFTHRVGGLVWFLEKGWQLRPDILHFHYGMGYSWAILPSLFRRSAVVVTCHDQMILEQWGKVRPHIRWAMKRIVKSTKVRWIAVSEEVKNQLQQLGVAKSRITVIPAFLPPLVNPQDPLRLPQELTSFLDSHSPRLSIYGWQMMLDNQGNDLYGFDMSIDLLEDLKLAYPQIGLVCCVPLVADREHYEKLQAQVRQNGLEKNVIFYREPLPEAYPLWQASDIYLRPTTTDGDAVAVREALSLGVSVVASDASPRPQGTVVFPKRDRESFRRAVREVLQKKQPPRENTAVAQDNYFDQIMSIYREVLA